jgi:hypothetical protein
VRPGLIARGASVGLPTVDPAGVALSDAPEKPQRFPEGEGLRIAIAAMAAHQTT